MAWAIPFAGITFASKDFKTELDVPVVSSICFTIAVLTTIWCIFWLIGIIFRVLARSKGWTEWLRLFLVGGIVSIVLWAAGAYGVWTAFERAKEKAMGKASAQSVKVQDDGGGRNQAAPVSKTGSKSGK